ncbi:putative NAD-P-binding protein [Lyophyllum shimeji]|uniref:NAD-P-binding protein n=1 Tax=Lyophyllum shimeji TaxID=47721 RepID=A0A9P3PRC6_LYOSH|nr:putative NAD-P-binding protein [Lyophyllum shimeji]
MRTTHIFLTGPTGYIGGSVLTRLLSHPLSDTFGITVLLREAEKVKEFRTLGVKPVIGSHSDLPLLQHLAADADVVLACADADDLDAAKAILAGLKDRFDKTGTPSTLIHTSGTGVLVDDAGGMHATENIYSDLDVEKLESLPPTQPHRPVDMLVVAADTQGYVKTYIILPSTIYGRASGPLVDLGLQNRHSQQIPGLVKIAMKRGEVGYVGLGKNIWPHVHIKEAADLYVLVFDHSRGFDHSHGRKEVAHGRVGYYFAENGEYVMYDLAKAIAETLYQEGKVKSPNPTSFTDEEMKVYFPNGTMYGANARCRAERSRAAGWHPRKGYHDLVTSIKGEIRS